MKTTAKTSVSAISAVLKGSAVLTGTLFFSVALVGLAANASTKAGMSADSPARYVLTDAMLAKELRAEPILTHEATGTVLLKLTEKEREELAHHAHENGRCGGHELLGELDNKSTLQMATARVGKVFSEFDRQLKRDEEFKLRSMVGIGLPNQPALKDTEIEKAVLEVSEANLKTTVDFLSKFTSRNHKNGDGQTAVLAFKTEIERVLKDSVVPFKLELVPHKNTPMNSLKLTIPGAINPTEIVVAGGHIDSIAQSFFGGGKKAPGADDNASGSANLLEAARIILKGRQPAKTIEIYWYAGEEGGLLGSAEIAADAKAKAKHVIGVLQLDMTLHPGDGEFKLGSMTDFTSLSMRDHLAKINSTYIGATIIEDQCGYGCSDHASWYKNGFPTLMPFEATKKRMNSNIHTERDVVNAQSSFRHSAMFTKIAVAFLMSL
jgi:leucyl aminopeptidase